MKALSGGSSIPSRDGCSGVVAALAALFLTIWPGVRADASQLRGAWDACGDAGVTEKAFTCDTNAGTDTLVVSLVATQDFPKLAHADIFMYVCFGNFGAVPDWWQLMDAGGCRYGALTATAASPRGNCSPIWDPRGGAGQEVTKVPFTVLNGFLFVLSVSVGDSTLARDIVAGQEFELARLVLDHTRTAGAGACQGCMVGANIGTQFVWLYSTDGSNLGMSSGAYVSWQDAALRCRAVTDVTRRTWGEIKSLYR